MSRTDDPVGVKSRPSPSPLDRLRAGSGKPQEVPFGGLPLPEAQEATTSSLEQLAVEDLLWIMAQPEGFRDRTQIWSTGSPVDPRGAPPGVPPSPLGSALPRHRETPQGR